MKLTIRNLLLASLSGALLVSGCGGTGAPAIANLFAGQHQGQMSLPDRTALAAMTANVDNNGNVTGRTIDAGGVGMVPGNLPVTGSVEANGQARINFGDYRLSGTMKRVQSRGAGTLFASGDMTDPERPGEPFVFEFWD